MSITAVTVSGTATFAGGSPVPNAVVSFIPDQIFSQSGTTVSVAQATFANASGAWSLTVNATNDAGTTTASGGTNGGYFIHVIDPASGEHLDDFRATVPNSPTTTTVTALRALEF